MSQRNLLPDEFTPMQLCREHQEPAGLDGLCQLCIEEEGVQRGWSGGGGVGLLIFLIGCGVGGFFLFRHLNPQLNDQQVSRGLIEEKGPAQSLAAEDLRAKTEGQDLAVGRVSPDAGGTVHTIPGGRLVVKARKPGVRVPRQPRVQKKHGGEIRRKPGGRVAIKLHGRPTPGGKPGGARPRTDTEETQRRRRRRLEDEVRALKQKQAQQNVRVLMYATSWCGACRAARAYFVRKRISYLEKDIDKDPAARQAMARLNPRGGVPTIVINGQVMVGFSPAAVQSALLRRR